MRRMLDRVVDGSMILAEVAITLMMAHITLEILARWILRAGLEAVNEVVAFYYMVGLTFLSLAFVTRADGHIAAQIFTEKMSQRPRELLEAIICVGLCAFMLILAWQTTREAIAMTEMGEVYQSGSTFLLKWPARWFVPAGSMIMALCALSIAIRKLAGEPTAPALKPAAHE
jgi:TRAP-type C4-dicarboxylate transport system permease small subunit